ncbi:MAG: N-acetylornithine carbamoyltransferase [Pseudomonadota bacterium]
MKHFLTVRDHSRETLDALIDDAMALKAAPFENVLNGRSVALLFLNPSMRTRTSFQVGVHQLGGHAVVLEPGKGSWGIEFESGTVMEGDAEEHIAEVAQVLSRYCDIIALRAFPPFVDWSAERTDPVIKAVAKHATVPVINMETIVHPCQALAMMMTLRERYGDVRGRKFLLTWTWHPKPLNTAVANSALMMASRFGMDVTLLCPSPEYALDEQFMSVAREEAASFTLTHDIESAYADADIVYAKSWGALPYLGDPEAEFPLRRDQRHFIVDEAKMALTNGGLFSHCLPLRRNVKATDGVMDADYCVAVDEAENRLHVQKAVMKALAASGE